MALTKLEFTKDWTNPEDFPDSVANPQQARANIQLLHNEVRDYMNNKVVKEVNIKNQVHIKDDTIPSTLYRFGFDNGKPYFEEVVE